MSKIKSNKQYAENFFKENPLVKTLWANPKGEFFTDINYANNSLEKDENGKIEKLEVFSSEDSIEVAKEIILPENPIVPEVINTLKVVEPFEKKEAIVIEKAVNDTKASKGKTVKSTTAEKVEKVVVPADTKPVEDQSK